MSDISSKDFPVKKNLNISWVYQLLFGLTSLFILFIWPIKTLRHNDIQASYGVYATLYVCLQ